MSDAISFAEIEDQSVQLLPARTVLSLLPAAITGPYGEPGQGQQDVNDRERKSA